MRKIIFITCISIFSAIVLSACSAEKSTEKNSDIIQNNSETTEAVVTDSTEEVKEDM